MRVKSIWTESGAENSVKCGECSTNICDAGNDSRFLQRTPNICNIRVDIFTTYAKSLLQSRTNTTLQSLSTDCTVCHCFVQLSRRNIAAVEVSRVQSKCVAQLDLTNTR